jgi:uncharacterized protein (TIGR02145 family)
MNKTKFLSLTASLVLAITFTLSCEDKEAKDKPAPVAAVPETVAEAVEPKTATSTQGTFIDSRDGKTYKKVKIGDQVWMAENLNYAGKDAGGVCYGGKEENCAKYGRLYSWGWAYQACPADWHLPTEEEWDALAKSVGANPGEKLKSKDWGGTDAYNFSALPGGFGDVGKQSADAPYTPPVHNGKFTGEGNLGLWWSATDGPVIEWGSTEAMRYIMDRSHGNLEKLLNWHGRMLSVRCVEPTEEQRAKAKEKVENAKKARESVTTFTDSRDKKVYKKVVIGKQTWMAQNLNFVPAKGSVCHGAKESNCDKYGRLYNWEAAMKACPAGWRLPTVDDWTELYEYTGSYDNLKSKTGWNKTLGNGSDEYGFAALPGGTVEEHSRPVGEDAAWWTATEPYIRGVTNAREYEGWEGEKKNQFSVRCIQN